MNLIRKNLKNIALIIIVILFAYAIIFKGNFAIILDTVKNCNYFFVGICFIFGLAYYLLDGINIALFAKIYDQRYTLKKGMVIALIAPFFNGITPFASGGQVAQVYVFKKQGIETHISIAIMLMHFIIYQSILVLYSAVILITQFHYFQDNFTQLFFLGIIGFVISSAVISALLLGSISKKFQEFIVNIVLKIAYRLHIIKDYDALVAEYYHQLDSFRDGLKILFAHFKVLIIAALVNVLRLTILYSIPYYAFRSLGIDTTVVRYYVYLGITSFVSLITSFIPIPGASGGSEGLFTVMFGLIFGNSVSRCAMLVWRFVTYYLMMILGASVFMISEHKYSKKEE